MHYLNYIHINIYTIKLRRCMIKNLGYIRRHNKDHNNNTIQSLLRIHYIVVILYFISS